MFGSLGGGELLLILVIALLLFGPRRLPDIGRTIGKALGEFRRATTDFKATLEREVDLAEVKQARDGLKAADRELRGATAPDAPAAAPAEPSAPQNDGTSERDA